MVGALRKVLLSWALVAIAGCAPGDANPEASDEADSADEFLDEAVSEAWSQGPGYGIGYRRAGEGDDIAIFYGGYGATLSASEAWADAAFTDNLQARGVGRLYAVQGPWHADYRDYEVGNSKLAKRLVGDEGAAAARIVVVAHSSGAFVAHELLSQLADGRDTGHAASDKVVYFNLDGAGGPPPKALANLRAAWAVSVIDAQGQRSMNAGTAQTNAANYGAAGKGGLHVLQSAEKACAPFAPWCLHMVCANERPHNRLGLDVADDYTDFTDRPVQTDYLSRLEP